MDIELQTNTTEPSLALRDLKFVPKSGFSTQLCVRSRGFACDRQLWPTPLELSEFLSALREIDRILEGSAVLQFDGGPDYIEVSADRNGHVTVHGEVFEAGLDHRFEFTFVTDQTCLRPLIDDLQNAVRTADVDQQGAKNEHKEHRARITWSRAQVRAGLPSFLETIDPAWLPGAEPGKDDGWSLVCRFESQPNKQGNPSEAFVRFMFGTAPERALQPGVKLRLFERPTQQYATVEILD